MTPFECTQQRSRNCMNKRLEPPVQQPQEHDQEQGHFSRKMHLNAWMVMSMGRMHREKTKALRLYMEGPYQISHADHTEQ